MEEINLKELYSYFKSKILWIVIIIVTILIVGNVYTILKRVPMYQSNTTIVLVGESKDGYNQSDSQLNQNLIGTYSEIIKSKTIAKEVINTLGLDMSPDELISSVTVTSKDDTELIEITVSTEDSKLSADIANSLTEVFREKVNQIYKIDNLSVIDIAEPSSLPYNIGTVKNIVIFALVGLIISCGVVFLIVYFDDTVKDEKDIESLLNIPVIASIPRLEDNEEGGLFKWKRAK